ncbi:MAG: cation:proton antiporter subunit C [Cyanobacteria bacterium P01_F01_bin.150]
MSAATISLLEALVFATILCGFFGIVLKQNLIMKIFSMDVMSTGVIALYVLVAARSGLFTPIANPATAREQGLSVDPGQASDTVVEAIAYADPVPQAVILTAIVIGFSIQALMLVGAMKLSRDTPSLDVRDIEERHT